MAKYCKRCLINRYGTRILASSLALSNNLVGEDAGHLKIAEAGTYKSVPLDLMYNTSLQVCEQVSSMPRSLQLQQVSQGTRSGSTRVSCRLWLSCSLS